MKEEEGRKIIKEIVEEWSKVYINQVFFDGADENTLKYEVEFSKPLPNKPIPEGTVKVDFEIELFEDDEHEIRFAFENESLKHKMTNTMRKNMFEKWIDRVLENKLKIKLQLHLGTQFEYTRFVDKKGAPIDPFVPKFDIMKVQDLQKETKKSQKINVDSPRFISTLERALIKLFEEADANNNGELEYQEFHNAFKLLSYDLDETDVRTLMALADENGNGRISWREFIPVGIDAIKTFLARNKILAKQKGFNKEINKDTMKLVFEGEIAKATQILNRRFEEFDTDKETKEHTGFIMFKQMENIFHGTSWLTPKEINILLRDYAMKYGYEKINYTNFANDLYDARFELAKSRVMETNLKSLEESIIQVCKKIDPQDTGKVHLQQLGHILKVSNKLVLTPYQVNTLLGYSDADREGFVEYLKFCPKIADIIDSHFSVEALRRKAQLVQLGTFKADRVKIPEYEDIELFKVFRDFDDNVNGFLETMEFVKCLESFKELDLSVEEQINVVITADVNGDGRIDYQECMKHFLDIVKLIKFHKELQKMYEDERQVQERFASETPAVSNNTFSSK